MFKTFETPTAVAEAAAELFLKKFQEATRFTVLLSGGRTPQLLYSLLSSPGYREKINWEKVYFFWGDERMVPPNHPDSNYRMIKETLFSKTSVSEKNIFQVRTELGDPDKVARDYEVRLKTFFKGPPTFDFTLLGMGSDGHTASLFPDSNFLHESSLEQGQRLVIACYVEHLKTYRISVTLKVLNASKAVLFLVTGKDKADALQEIRTNKGNLPANLVKPQKGEVFWFVDKDAASKIEGRP